jgi:hypothetical protein
MTCLCSVSHGNVVPEYEGAETGNFDNPAAFSAPETFFAQESSVSVAAEAQEMLVVLARGTRSHYIQRHPRDIAQVRLQLCHLQTLMAAGVVCKFCESEEFIPVLG